MVNAHDKELSQLSLAELWQLFPIILEEYNPEYPRWYEDESRALTAGLDQAGLGKALARMNHVGSTAIPGLVSKPTVDILLEVHQNPGRISEETHFQGNGHQQPGCIGLDRFRPALESLGWTLMSEQRDNPVQPGDEKNRGEGTEESGGNAPGEGEAPGDARGNPSGSDTGPRMVFNKGYTPQGYAPRVFHLHLRYLGDWNEFYFRDYLRVHPDIARRYGDLKRSLLAEFRHNRDGYTEAKTEFIQTHTLRALEEYSGRYSSPGL